MTNHPNRARRKAPQRPTVASHAIRQACADLRHTTRLCGCDANPCRPAVALAAHRAGSAAPDDALRAWVTYLDDLSAERRTAPQERPR